ncbi:MAG TPA: hypothetical protein VFI23_03280 [Rhizomicrobium sp.]|nr:hypothetical protein [Rhizomicrobium sp.]
MSALGIFSNTGKTVVISAYADVRHEQLFFERQQSLAMRELEWEDRLQPPLPWSALILRGFGTAIIACVVLAMLI